PGNMRALFYFLLEGLGNPLPVTCTCLLSALLTGLTLAVLRRRSPLPLQKIRYVVVIIRRGIQINIAVFNDYFGLQS
ncbi:amino acid ABC transporter permease, partial [Salmonella enterica subsp. enterica serovar Weltevreden]|nr:amino acid ABC transporter permease [Salmonella enterica subsp. enterica serovar Weltevreden]